MQQNIHLYASADACCFVLERNLIHVGTSACKGTSQSFFLCAGQQAVS